MHLILQREKIYSIERDRATKVFHVEDVILDSDGQQVLMFLVEEQEILPADLEVSKIIIVTAC